MKKEIKELKKIVADITFIKNHIKEIKKSTFFIIFGTEQQRDEELLIAKKELKDLLKKEFTSLENLQKACEQAKVKNSYKSRKLNLETNGK